MKKSVRSSLFFVSLLMLVAGCTTPVAIDPVSGREQTATFTAGTFRGDLPSTPDRIFIRAIRIMDQEGYFRTGEVHRENRITIYARRVGDERVTVRITANNEGGSEIAIRIGTSGDLPASQSLYAKIRAAL